MKGITKTLFALLIAACVSVTAFAAEVNVNIDGNALEGARLIESVTYVPLRKFSESTDAGVVGWNAKKREASVTDDKIQIYIGIGNAYIEGNDRVLYSGNRNLIIDGATYVPIRSLSKIIGADLKWDAASRTAFVTTDGTAIQSGEEFYNKDDLNWLSRVISAESKGEPLSGKIAVGNVVLNRVESDEFPDSVHDVVFDTAGGVQFTPVANGSIHNEPTKESIIAAKICLEKYKITDKNVLFFFNPSISTSTWIPENRDYVMTIGQHKFYA